MPGASRPTYDLNRFTLDEMVGCGAAIRTVGGGSFAETADRIVRFLHTEVRDRSRGPAFVLARCYQVKPLKNLEPARQAFARGLTPEPIDDDTVCLTLAATAGLEPAWNDWRSSAGHQAIPLPSAERLQRLPMVAALLEQIGMDPAAVVARDRSIMLDLAQREFNVFFVERAEGSPQIPAQGFVARYGVRSALGFGFVQPPRDLVAFILFSRVHIAPVTATLFKTLSLNAKLALLAHAGEPM